MSILNKNTCPRGGVASHRRKHGFTITELVIVIAVIAILAAVLIPTFANLINKANESADLQTVKNLNTILASEQTVSQKKPSTMSEVLEQAESGGYVVDRLSPTSEGNDILWEQYSNRFVLADENGKIIFKDDLTEGDTANDYNFWKITDDANDLNKSPFSLYLSDGSWGTSVTHGAGIDVGENTDIDVTYESDAERNGANEFVIIRTNGGELTVDASKSTVKHYDSAETVKIVAVAGNSYHEFGKVLDTLSITTGRIYLESGSNVGVLDCTVANEGAKVGKASSATVDTVYVKDEASKGTILDASLLEAIDNGECDFVLEEDAPATERELFDGGLGTASSPYLIKTEQSFVNIGKLSDKMQQGQALYFRLTADIDLAKIENSLSECEWGYVIVCDYFCGELDGDGHSIYSSKQKSVEFCEESINDASFKNFSIIQRGGEKSFFIASSVNRIYGYLGKVVFENITVKGITDETVVFFGNNSSSFVSFVQGDVKFINCKNSVTLSITNGGGYAGVFIGGYAFYSNSSGNGNIARVQFIDCENEAEVTGVAIGFFTGSANQARFAVVDSLDELATAKLSDTVQAYAYVENCRNMGTMVGSQSCGAFSRGNTKINVEFNALANEALNNSNTNGTSKFTSAATMAEGNLAKDSGLKQDGVKVKILPTAESQVATYTVNISVGISYLKEDNSSAGSSYVSITKIIQKDECTDWSAPIVSKIIASTKYEELGNKALESYPNIDDNGHRYAEVEQDDDSIWIVVDYDSLLEQALAGTKVVNVGATPNYLLKCLSSSNGLYGSYRYTVNTSNELVSVE